MILIAKHSSIGFVTNMQSNGFLNISKIISESLQSVKSNYRNWFLLMQISLLISVVGFFAQIVFTGLTGIFGVLVSFVITSPLYAALYTSGLKITTHKFQSSDLMAGYKNLFPVLGIASLESIFFFVLIFPLNTYIGYLVTESGIPLETFQNNPMEMNEQSMTELMTIILDLARANALNMILLTIPVWPAFAWIRSRMIFSYFYVIENKSAMLPALIKSFQISKKDHIKITLLILITDILFPVMFVFFIISYPLKYAIFGRLFQILLDQKMDNTVVQPTQDPILKIKNPYLD